MRIEVTGSIHHYHHIVPCASGEHDIHQMLAKIIERLTIMPTKDEFLKIVSDAAAAEREQVRAAVIKAVQDALANAPETISQATTDAVVASIQSVYEPDAPAA